MPLGREVGLSSCNTVLDGTELPPKGLHNPLQFLAHVYCGQTAACISIPLGMEAGLSPGDIVLDEGPAPPPKKKGHSPPIFGGCLLWPNGWMDQDATCYRGRPWHRRHCVRWGPAPPNGHSPQFLACVYCGQGSPISATAEFLLLIV